MSTGKENKKEHVVAVVGESLASQFEIEFTLIASIEIIVTGIMWHPDSGVVFHMTGNKEFFSDLEEKDIQMNIEFGDDGRYSVIEIDTTTF